MCEEAFAQTRSSARPQDKSMNYKDFAFVIAETALACEQTPSRRRNERAFFRQCWPEAWPGAVAHREHGSRENARGVGRFSYRCG